MEYYESTDDESLSQEYDLHNAAEFGDIERLENLLEKYLNPPEILTGNHDPTPITSPLPYTNDGPDVNKRDEDNCTPLHLAILNAKLKALETLLKAGARVTSRLEGSPPLHVVVCVASHREHRSFAIPALTLLIQHGAVVLDRDDNGRTPLHWASLSGLDEVCRFLLQEAIIYAERQRQQDEEGIPEPDHQTALPELWEFQDKQGNTALQLAARYGQHSIVSLLLSAVNATTLTTAGTITTTTTTPDITTFIKQRNKSGLNALHMAALGGNATCVELLAAACPSALTITTRQGLTPLDLAVRRDHSNVIDLLNFLDKNADTKGNKSAGITAATAPHHNHPQQQQHHKPRHTLLLAPQQCLDHHTVSWPILRGASEPPPPENVNRLRVLTEPGMGILRTIDFADALRWDERDRKAALGDVLRVHDWAYVRSVKGACEKLISIRSDIGHLDGDTAISRLTYHAALVAAGATTHAVDELMAGKARNAFCAVRPPGHHAGPHGVVTSAKDPNGSHGFCLFNNVAIGAAYAMTVYRHAGIKKVALLDFDVHHGNGTEACVANTAPSVDKFAFVTPYGENIQEIPVYKPWRNDDDKENIFFASVQGYGPKMAGMSAFVYPGSGATCDTRAVEEQHQLEEVDMDADEHHDQKNRSDTLEEVTFKRTKPSTTAIDHPSTPDVIEEDPDNEFIYNGGELPRTEGPRIIDVGIPGPGARVSLWRRAWRDKILPALAKFDPDMIFISAGFDAHKKDVINFSYIGIQEKEYEWLTDQIVQVANRCCHGRVVSVLEGGYRIEGRVVSAFARSVAAHVRAMAEPNGQKWDPMDAKWEREHEKQMRAEAEAKKAAAAAMAAEAERLAVQARMAAAATAASAENGVGEGKVAVGGGGDDAPAAAPAVPAVPDEGEDDGGRRKRRRGSVDYVALNKKLEEEAKA